LGLGLGYLLTFAAERFRIGIPSEIFYIDHLPVHVEARDFVFVGLASVLVCVAATIFPATMAAKLRPVDSLRHE
jgi:lipoprotein-releasing system permease protein